MGFLGLQAASRLRPGAPVRILQDVHRHARQKPKPFAISGFYLSYFVANAVKAGKSYLGSWTFLPLANVGFRVVERSAI